MEKNEHKRDGFRSRSGFIIACIGSAVGMGNIWRFPMLVSTWGGLTFLLPYFIFVILIASTGVIEEFALGRAGGAGPMGSFGKCTELRYGRRRIGERIGYIPILGSLALAIGYTCVMGWIFKYTFMAFSGDMLAMGQDMDKIVGTFNSTASSWGANVWIIIAVVVSFAIMSFGIAGGIERANKVMMPVLFVLFLVQGFWLAFHAENRFCTLVGIGIMAQIAWQVFCNIAVVTNTLPNTGISLPFFSSGGTSLILLLAEMGVMVNIGRNGERARQERKRAYDEREARRREKTIVLDTARRARTES